MSIKIEYIKESLVNEELFSDLLKYGANKLKDTLINMDSDFSNILRHVKNGEYGSALRIASRKNISSDTEFENVTVNGHKFGKIKGGMACLAVATSKSIDIKGVTDALHNAYHELFLNGEFGSSDVFNQRCYEADKFKDCVSFILTAEGRRIPEYSESNDLDLIKFFNEIRIFSNGSYRIKSFPLIKILVEEEFKNTVKFLCEHDMLSFTSGMEKLFSDSHLDVLKIIQKKSPHKFILHSPEVMWNIDNTKLEKGGTLYNEFIKMGSSAKSSGYDISNYAEQTVSIDNTYRIVEDLYRVYTSYLYNGENISENPFEKYLSNVSNKIYNFLYGTALKRNNIQNNSVVNRIKDELQLSVNALLSQLSMPPIKILFPDNNKSNANLMEKIRKFNRVWGNSSNRDVDNTFKRQTKSSEHTKNTDKNKRND